MNDELLEQIIAQHAAGASVESLCAAHPEHARQIQRVLLTVDRLRLVEDPPLPARATQAQADFLALAAQKRAAAQPRPAARRRGRPLWAQRWVWAAASLLLLLTFSGGVVVAAAANSVPGDTLYRIKRWSESVELALSSSDGQITRRIEFCNERRRELAQLVGASAPVPLALVEEIGAETAAIEQELERKGPNDQRWATLNTLTNDVAATLAIVPTSDPALVTALESTRIQSLSTEVHSREVLSQQPQQALPTVVVSATPTAIPAAPGQTAVLPPGQIKTPKPTHTPKIDKPTHTPKIDKPTHTPKIDKPTHTPKVEKPTDVPAPPKPTKEPKVDKPTDVPAPPKPTKEPKVDKPTDMPAPPEPTAIPAPPEPTDMPAPPEPTAIPAPPEPTNETPGNSPGNPPGNPPSNPPGNPPGGQPTHEPQPTDEPKPTKEPKPTDEPKATKEPKPTKEPK